MSLKPLSIMYKATTTTDESLMSPPLTPTDDQHPLSPILIHTTSNHRKDFIHAYSKMVPYLRPSNKNSRKYLELNVYQHYYSKYCNVKPKEKHKVIIHQEHKKKRVSNYLPTGKDAALAFDAVDIDLSDHAFYPEGWVPCKQALDTIPVKVCWKGAPLSIDTQPYLNQLHPLEASMASILRLTPIQYLRCKRTLILASRTLKIQQIPFTKSIAQKLCRVDVNKTSALWTAFHQLGWFNGPI